jgi:7-cyano-7-deazaguanine synthase
MLAVQAGRDRAAALAPPAACRSRRSRACDAQGVDLPQRYLSAAKVTFETWIDATCLLTRRWKLKQVGVLAGLMPAAVLLLSGGLDSTTLLAHALAEGFDVHAMTFRYGQRHATEVGAARRVAAAYGLRDHVIVDIDLRTFGGSALTSDGRAESRDVAADNSNPRHIRTGAKYDLSVVALAGRGLERRHIFIGVNARLLGLSDCRPEYIAAFEHMANLATRGGVDGTNRVQIRAPFLHYTKAEIIKRGLALGVDYGITQSCYDPPADGIACGHCDACQLRLKGFHDAGASDPAQYL